ncbi:MAG TPA: type IV secretion system DNA-binding domain-containing protein [Pyrinomonadaceae bacterium]|nr:type IV secretion system DNA-binding domain-containing protein [Pyrinomonadaceae bacterium]
MTEQELPLSSPEITYFATVTNRGKTRTFGIKRPDRRGHMYILGKTGTGKSTLIENLIIDDIRKGYGIAVLDPHGDLIGRLKDRIPSNRKGDIIDFDATDPNMPWGFNPLANVAVSKKPLAASGLISVFKHLWKDNWGPRMEHILRNALLTLLDYPEATLNDLLKLLADKPFRTKVLPFVKSEQVRNFWLTEFNKYNDRLKVEAVAPIQNKVGAFLSHPLLNEILTHPERRLSLRMVMDEQKILLVNLAKGSIGEDTANMLGSLLISRFDLAALSRADTDEERRKDYYLYLDEFHNFTTESLAPMLSELRKYRLSLVIANQFLSQISPSVKDAILGNVGTIIVFRIGAADAEALYWEFQPELKSSDFTSLPNHWIYLRMMIDGQVSRPFNAITLPPRNS